MSKATKAALISALIFPGAGQLFLKKYVTGFSLLGTAVVCLYILITNIINTALQLAEKIQSGQVQVDLSSVTALVSQQIGSEAQQLNIVTLVLVAIWLISIIHAYKSGSSLADQ